MSNRNFYIGQWDRLPKLFAILGGEYDPDYPADEQRIYNDGDVIKLYVEFEAGDWEEFPATVEQIIDDGKAIKVAVVFDPEDVSVPGRYRAYFRNETIQLSFPQDGTFNQIYVTEKGHEPET